MLSKRGDVASGERRIGDRHSNDKVGGRLATGLLWRTTLEGKGPFTVFAPTSEAFDKRPAGTVDTLVKPENKGKLTAILTYHVVPGKISAAALAADIKKGGGQATLKRLLAQFQRKKNQFLFLPLPVRK